MKADIIRVFTRLRVLLIVSAVMLSGSCFTNFAQDISADTVIVVESVETMPVQPTHFELYKAKMAHRQARDRVRFVWGAEAGGSVDMSQNDMSAMSLSLFAGIRYKFLDIVGVGTGIDIMISNSGRIFPICGIVRTSFSTSPQLMFLELRGGISENYLENDHRTTGGYGFAGLGFNLARGRNFVSHIIVGYQYLERTEAAETETQHKDIHCAVVRLGITF